MLPWDDVSCFVCGWVYGDECVVVVGGCVGCISPVRWVEAGGGSGGG